MYEIFNRIAGFLTDPIIKIPNRRFIPDCLSQVVCSGKNLSYLGCKTDNIIGGSISFDYEQSLTGALGEFVERYAAGLYVESDFIFATYDELKESGKRVIDIGLLNYYSKQQYLFQNENGIKLLTNKDRLNWCISWDYINNCFSYLPAFCIYMPIKNKYLIQTSTGLAAGKTLKDAVISGFLECIERDAFANFWYRQNEIIVPQYTAKTILMNYVDSIKIKNLVNNRFVRFKFFDLVKLVGIETIVTFLYFEYKGKVYQSLGAASRFTKEEAIVKATMEAWQGVEYALSLDKKDLLPDIMNLDLVNNFDKHFHFYNKYINLRDECPIITQAMNWNCGDDNIFEQDENNLCKDFSQEELKKICISNLFYKDITPIDIEELGYNVVRVVVPQLSQLTGVHNLPFLGGKFENMTNLFAKYPHPFP